MKCSASLAAMISWASVAVAACSPGSGGDSAAAASSGVMAILGCSLGCSESNGVVSCGSKAVFRNEVIAFEFTQPVLSTSVNKNTIQVTDDETGAVPLGSYDVDPTNPRRVRFRPSLTFDSQGHPVFGLREGAAYTITVRGADQLQGASGEFVRSTSGRANATTMVCHVAANLGVRDPNPGAPSVRVFFDVVTGVDPDTGDVLSVERGVLANGDAVLEDVYRGTVVELEFDDLMNPSTVVNPVTGTASLIRVAIDGDGDVATEADRIEVHGSWSIFLDQESFTTIARFTPLDGLPSAGLDPARPRLLVVSLPHGIADLGDNTLVDPGTVAGALEYFFFEETRLPGGEGEDFTTTEFRDARRTGAHWGAVDVGLAEPVGALTPGLGGGSGRLGDLVVHATGSAVVLSTVEQTFAPGLLLDDYDPITGMPAAGEQSLTVTDGVFEFASVTVHPGATLRFEGDRPARLYSRGSMVVQGCIDVSGSSVGPQNSLPCDVSITDPADARYCFFLEEGFDPRSMDPETYADLFRGGPGGAPGPGGGAGGRGGDLSDPDASDPLGTLLVRDFPGEIGAGGIDNPNSVIELDGRHGGGVPAFDAPGNRVGGGVGGAAYPVPLPSHADDLGGLVFDGAKDQCWVRWSPASGSGGGNATRGGDGQNGYEGTGPPDPGVYGPPPPVAAGGDASLGFTEAVTTLDPARGYLRGGAGGGGSGAGLLNTTLNGGPSTGSCLDTPRGTPLIADFIQNMGAGGGGGGGAIQLQAGSLLVLDGVVDASGGEGGGRSSPGGRMAYAAGAGSGAGGSILLQSDQVQLAGLADRLLVAGGGRSRGGGKQNRGGAGGAGRIRVESGTTPEALLPFTAVEARIQPDGEARASLPGSPTAQDILSVANFEKQSSTPGSYSGAQSCWLKPAGNVFFTSFFEDEGERLGWDMEVFVPGLGNVSWRRVGALFPDESIEQNVGSNLGEAPLVVRFQAARARAPIADPCNVDIGGGELLAASLTPWVRHPAELDDFHGVEELRPNLIRYQVVFDDSHEFAASFSAVTSLWIRAQGE